MHITMLGCNTLYMFLQNIWVQAVISKSPVPATIDAPCSLHGYQTMPQVKQAMSPIKLLTYIDATDAMQTSSRRTHGPIITQTVDDLLHKRSLDLGERLTRSHQQVSRRIITPFAFERCSRRTFVLLMPVDTSHGAHMYRWTPTCAVDQCSTAWPNKPLVSRCPDVTQSAHQGYAYEKASTWCTLAVSQSLIDCVRRTYVRTWNHRSGISTPRTICQSCTKGAGRRPSPWFMSYYHKGPE